MGKNNQFIKTVGISTVIALSGANLVVAQDISDRELGLTPETIAQATDPSEDIIKPAQKPIDNTEKLNPSANPLSFPTQTNEVEVEPEKPISLEQAIELSLKNNQDVTEARLQLERSGAALREARAELYPTLDFTTGLNYGNAAFLDSSIEQNVESRAEDLVEQNPGLSQEQAISSVEQSFNNLDSATFTYNSTVNLGYDIFNGGRRGATIKANQKQLRSSELELERIVEETRFETARDYYNLQNSDALVKIEQAAVEDARQTLKDAQLLEKAGLGTRFDVLRAEVELAQAQQRLSTATSNQNISRRQLAETLNVSHDTDLSTADAIEEAGTWELSLSESIVQAFKNRAELEQLLLQREIAEENRTIALSRVRPTIGASANYSLDNDFEDDNVDFNDRYQVGLNLQWTLFDGGAARASARQSEIDAEVAETQFANQRNQIRFAVEQAYFSLEANQKNIGTATKEVELARESLRLARLRFQAGVGTQTDVIEAQTQLTTARGNLLSSIIDFNQSYVDLQRQVSNNPDNGLQDLP